jgi:serine/threonine protein kinase
MPSPVSANRAREIFSEAIEHHPSRQWPAFLDFACDGDESLRQQVERLLNAYSGLHSFMAQPAAGEPTILSDAPPAALGTMIGPYKLREQIGEGGMGIVYVADQERPVRRRVALKVIKPGMDTREVVARFEAERQALALMDHPNIARVLEAGATDTGRPYFVMELVRGGFRSPTTWIRRARACGSGWSCSCRSVRRCSTRTRRGSSTAT